MGVSASFQVAVGHRHAAEVNYHIERDSICTSLSHIRDEGFEIALDGSVRSTEQIEWYVEEATKSAKQRAVPSAHGSTSCPSATKLCSRRRRARNPVRHVLAIRTGLDQDPVFLVPVFPYSPARLADERRRD